MTSSLPTSALVLTGGGARTAYQAGVLQFVAETFPEHAPEVVTGSGMGGVNAALWSAGGDSVSAAAETLVRFWGDVTPANVFEPRSIWDLFSQLMNHTPSRKQSLLDLSPLRDTLTRALGPRRDGTLPGVKARMDAGRLRTLALTTSRYATGQTVTWTETDGDASFDDWAHGRRQMAETDVTLDHVVASASLALLFPAVRIGAAWHGAGVGMLHPLAPAVRLGAERLLVVSTRPAQNEAANPAGEPDAEDPYPSPLQIASLLSNTLLLDAPEQDAVTAQRIDDLVRRLPPEDRPFSPADVLVIRPSTDLTALADGLGLDVGDTLGATLRYLHAEEAHLPDLLSVLLYARDFVRRCLLLGYTDAENREDDVAALLGVG